MALTIKMRIDENPEHSYVFSTGDGGQIELIPLSVVQNGEYRPAEANQAFNLVTVNVPTPVVESLNITENGTFTSESGHVWNVVNVNVEPLLEAVSRTITENGTYTITPSEGYDGINQIMLNIDVPTGGGGDVVTVYKRISPSVNGDVFTVDLSEDAPQGKDFIGFILRPGRSTWQNIANGSGRNSMVYYAVTRDIDDNTKWFKCWLYKGSTTQMTTPTSGGIRGPLLDTAYPTPPASVVAYDSVNKSIKLFAKMFSDTSANYGFASYCPYELFAFYK